MASSAQQASIARSTPRTVLGVVLFLGWGVLAVIWIASTVDRVADGEIAKLITALGAIALMALLAGMEGLEVAVIDRWKVMYPDRSTSQLAGWLAARQLFVALIVTSATLLANRGELVVPFVSATISDEIWLRLFDLVGVTFTVLWFAQIFPKHLAATNPDRYLEHTQQSLFPIVEFVRQIGISQPGEWVASGVERRLDWPLEQEEQLEEAVRPREESLGQIWRELIPESPAARRAPRP